VHDPYRAAGVPDGGTPPMESPPPTLDDDALVMGLPKGPPWALIAALAGAALLIVALVIYLAIAR
jgi:hypothetical protein